MFHSSCLSMTVPLYNVCQRTRITFTRINLNYLFRQKSPLLKFADSWLGLHSKWSESGLLLRTGCVRYGYCIVRFAYGLGHTRAGWLWLSIHKFRRAMENRSRLTGFTFVFSCGLNVLTVFAACTGVPATCWYTIPPIQPPVVD